VSAPLCNPSGGCVVLVGCCTGSVAMRSTGINRNGTRSGEIVIVEGSGTGDLAGLEGSGEVVYNVITTFTTQDEQVGALECCRAPEARRSSPHRGLDAGPSAPPARRVGPGVQDDTDAPRLR
jgi:hypothetical protein